MDNLASVVATGRNHEQGATLDNRHTNIQFIKCDLSDRAKLIRICKNARIVFHCGALSAPWGEKKAFEEANVFGTRNILDACIKNNIERLIYVSSPSIYQNNGLTSLKENAPLSSHPLNHYIRTKIQTETLITQEKRVNTITLRPRAIFGPGDRTLFPRILRANRNGRFPLIGRVDPLMDCTYIDNVVDALLLGMEAAKSCMNKAYNITNDEPILRSELLKQLFHYTEQNYNPKVLPLCLAKPIASALELGSHLLTKGKYEPILTRYTVEVMSKDQTWISPEQSSN